MSIRNRARRSKRPLHSRVEAVLIKDHQNAKMTGSI